MLTGKLFVVTKPCNHVDLEVWRGLWKLYAASCYWGSLCGFTLSQWCLMLCLGLRMSQVVTRPTFPWSGGDSDSNCALRAIWQQHVQKWESLCQCKAISHCCSYIHAWFGIIVSVCIKLRNLSPWLEYASWKTEFSTLQKELARPVWLLAFLPWPWATSCQHQHWCSCREPHQRHGIVKTTYMCCSVV